MKYDLKNKYKQQSAIEYLEALIKKEANIELREMKMPRSIDANRLYWVWMTAIEVETKMDKNECHYLYRALFLQKDESEILELIECNFWERCKRHIEMFSWLFGLQDIINAVAISTTALDSKEMSDYMNKIRKHARINHGVILLTLDDVNFNDFYREYGFY